MPVHDWTKIDAGMFHDFHNEWLVSIKHALNHGILPAEYYAMTDQHAGDFIPDILTLGAVIGAESESARANGATVLSRPRRKAAAETELGLRRRKRKMVTVRQVSNDDVVAFVEIVSPGNKDSHRSIRAFVDKIAGLLEQGIHALIVDVIPAGRRDLQGIHGAVWQEIAHEEYRLPKRKPLTVVSYEVDASVKAYIEHFAVGDKLPNGSLFLEPGGCVEVPLEKTYSEAFDEVPKRWRDQLIS